MRGARSGMAVDGVRDDIRHRRDEFRPGVERGGAPDLDVVRTSEGLRLHVKVVEDLEVVGDKPDRADEHVARAGLFDRGEQVWAEPWLTGGARGREGKLPPRQLHAGLDEPAALEQPVLVPVAFSHDAGREAVGGEEQAIRPGFLEALRNQLLDRSDEGGMAMEPSHENQLAGPGLFQGALVGPETHVSEMGRKWKADQPAHARSRRLGSAVGDERRCVLHAYEDRKPKPIPNRGGLSLSDRREWRATDGSIPRPQVIKSFRRRFAPAADVRVVVLDARLAGGAAVSHAQDTRCLKRHAPPATRAQSRRGAADSRAESTGELRARG